MREMLIDRMCYQKEIVLYAHFKKLLYCSVECSYAKYGYRGNSRQKDNQARCLEETNG